MAKSACRYSLIIMLSFLSGCGQFTAKISEQIDAFGDASLAPKLGTPTVPNNLQALANSAYSIALSWEASTVVKGKGTVSSYNIYRDAAKLASIPASQIAYQDTGLNPSTSYAYQVSALSSTGRESTLSPSVGATTLEIGASPTPTPTPVPTPTPTPVPTPTPTPVPTPTPTPVPTSSPNPSPAPTPSASATPNPATVALDEFFLGPFPSWKSVKDFGAKGDGITDDTAAIQAALNSLKSVYTNNWSVLYFPAGTYRITQQLATIRSTHQDYLGAQIIGENPETTAIIWDGAAGGTMIRWSAWYDKVSRLTFDGRGRAGAGMVRAGAFSTYSELSELVFKDIPNGVCLNLGAGEGYGIAEEMILRSRFYRCGTAIATWDYNSLDIYIWYSYFEDNNVAIHNVSGAFHAYENRFVRSKSMDLRSTTNMQSSIINNVSFGSASFTTQLLGDVHLQGNKIYATTGIPLDLRETAPAVLIDNVIQGPDALPQILMRGAENWATHGGKDTLLAGNTFITNNLWPVRVSQDPFMHGGGTSVAPGRELEKVNDGNDLTSSVIGLWMMLAGYQWAAPSGTQPVITSYAVTSTQANDWGGDGLSDPTDWILNGSNNWGYTWTPLDTRTGEIFTAHPQKKTYTIASPGAYSLYFLSIKKNRRGEVPGKGGWILVAEFDLIDALGRNLARDSASLMTGGDEFWDKIYVDQQMVVPPSLAQIPSSLQPWEFAIRQAATVIEVSSLTGDAIQAAINQAASLPTDSHPVVHLPKGNYKVATTVVVPPLTEISIVGDGASENGSVLGWTGSGSGPVLRFSGPSRSVARDLGVHGGSSADGLIIDKADQLGGRIYGYQVQGNGAWAGGGHLVDVSFDINGVEQSDVNVNASGMVNFYSGVRVTGGPLRSSGLNAAGKISFLTGASAAGNRMFDVRNGGNLVATAFWYEGDWNYTGATLADLTSSSSGSLTISSMLIASSSPYGLLRTQDFAGSLTVLGTGLNNSTGIAIRPVSFAGGGSNILMCTNSISLNVNDQTMLSADQTSSGTVAMMLNNDYTPMTGKVIWALPSAGFVQRQLESMRAVRTSPAEKGPANVTDVKLFRVNVGGGDNRAAVKINAQ